MEINNNQEYGLPIYHKNIQTRWRGKDPDNHREKCLEVCQTYLSSYWLTLGLKDVEVERLTGGMTNQIYRCKALTTKGVEDNVTPNEAVIRFYGKKYDFKTCSNNSRFFDGLIAWIASSEGFGPKMYGLFDGGQVLKYYKNRNMAMSDLHDQAIMIKLSHKLAKLHSQSPPISKDGDWLKRLVSANVDQLAEDLHRLRPVFQKYGCEALLKCDLRVEIQWLTELMAGFDSPVVFSHNDFRMGNILMTDSNDIVLVDFDFSCYGYRAYDFASLFGANENNVQMMFSDNESSIVRQFIACYVKQCEQMNGKEYSGKPLNSVERIHQEFKVLMPLYFMFAFKSCLSNRADLFLNEEEAMLTTEHTLRQFNDAKLLLIKQISINGEEQ